jgi:anti-anti-sigma factor
VPASAVTRTGEFPLDFSTTGNFFLRKTVKKEEGPWRRAPLSAAGSGARQFGQSSSTGQQRDIRGAHMHIRGDHAELVVGGRLDVRSAADARTVLHDALDAGQGDLVLDLRELDSWDATGLGVIMGAHRRAGRCGRRLVLREVPPQMRRVLVATRLHRILTIAS